MSAQNELIDSAKVALNQMCMVSAPNNAFTDAVDRLDAAITQAEKSKSENGWRVNSQTQEHELYRNGELFYSVTEETVKATGKDPAVLYAFSRGLIKNLA